MFPAPAAPPRTPGSFAENCAFETPTIPISRAARTAAPKNFLFTIFVLLVSRPRLLPGRRNREPAISTPPLRARPETLAPRKEGVPYQLLRMTVAYDDGIRKATTRLLVGGRAPRRRRHRNGDIFNKLRCRRRRGRNLAARATTGSPDDLVELEDWQQDREDDGEHDSAHREDEQRLEQRHERGDPAVELAALLGGRALEQLAESPARLAACDHVHEDRREELR